MAKTQRRNLIVLGVGPNEFLIRAEGNESDVKEGLTRLLPTSQFELEPVNARTAAKLESRLSDAQLKLASRFSGEAGIKPSRNLETYRLRLTNPAGGVVATATSSGVLKFNPQIAEIRKPLGGGIGPVGITVGVGISGKF